MVNTVRNNAIIIDIKEVSIITGKKRWDMQPFMYGSIEILVFQENVSIAKFTMNLIEKSIGQILVEITQEKEMIGNDYVFRVIKSLT